MCGSKSEKIEDIRWDRFCREARAELLPPTRVTFVNHSKEHIIVLMCGRLQIMRHLRFGTRQNTVGCWETRNIFHDGKAASTRRNRTSYKM
jgi:hypothetical protein